jgi:hypothetical protein
MGFWDLMILKDDLICKFIDYIYLVASQFKFREKSLLNKQAKLFKISYLSSVSNKKLVILLNGPSLRTQDISVLADENNALMFVNRGFNHPLYRELKPQYHVFIDNKMISGEWSLTWIDEILSLVPDITFIMPISWSSNDKLQPYIKRGISIYWLKPDSICKCLGVSGACFQFAVEVGFKKIFFTGFEANGLGHELIKSNSHFYGVNEENLRKTSKDFVIDLLMHSRHLHDLIKFSKYCVKHRIDVFNLTDGGILDMFPRIDINEVRKINF